MTKQLTTEITIEAPADRVWAVLTDLTAYSDWNPFIVRAEGEPALGSRLTLRMQPVGGRSMTMRPTVTELEPGTRLGWRGRLGVPGLLDAHHSFVLEPLPGRRTRLLHSEVFSGILVPFLRTSLDRGTLPAFHLMNRALEERSCRSEDLREH